MSDPERRIPRGARLPRRLEVGIESVIAGYLHNPFEVPADIRQQADDLLDSLDVGELLRRLVDAGDIERAKLLLLAAGHRRACRHPDAPAQVLDARLLPPDVARRLPRPAGHYLRIVMAAGRCHRVLSSVYGRSAFIHRTRREVWAACFGNSLRHAMDLEQVIHDHDVLLLGETGTGKEAFARAVQDATPGPRDGGPAPRATINAAAIPDTLVESELFGHVKGAFTGAAETRMGRLRSAHGGSFFLDEVGDLPLTTQAKLLRVIETNEIHPLGADRPQAAEVRYVAATHKDLEALVAERSFRQDLFERLAGIIIRIPPLRDRPEDIIEIGLSFVQRYLGPGAPERLAPIERWLRSDQAMGYAWPGNVRELQNVLRNLLLGLPPGLKQGVGQHQRPGTAAPAAEDGHTDGAQGGPALPERIACGRATLDEVSDWYIRRVHEQSEGNLTQTARILGVDRSTVRRRLDP